jgi:predicted PurR-regulated permease PerM
VVTPVVAFYLLCDWQRMIAIVDGWCRCRSERPCAAWRARSTPRCRVHPRPGAAVPAARRVYTSRCWLIGLNFALLIGVLSGLISFIPLRRLDHRPCARRRRRGRAVLAGMDVDRRRLAIFFVGQFVEGNILQPKLVGASVGLHPVWLMFALFAFGYLFGFVGLLLAVPMAAAVGVLARFGAAQVSDEPLLHGGEAR